MTTLRARQLGPQHIGKYVRLPGMDAQPPRQLLAVRYQGRTTGFATRQNPYPEVDPDFLQVAVDLSGVSTVTLGDREKVKVY